MKNIIHPTAIIEDGAQIGANVQIGPYCVIGSNVVLKDNVVLKSHVVIEGQTIIGEGTKVFPFASLGTQPQDLKYDGEPSSLHIGKNNTIREHVTMNPGTGGVGRMETVVGDNCLFMMASHVAHDCIVGNNVILANNATLAGHVEVGDFAIIGGLSAVHQFARIGEHAMIGGMSGVENDVIPYGLVKGERASLHGLNIIGLKRRGFDNNDVRELQSAYGDLFMDEGTFDSRIEKIANDYAEREAVSKLIDFAKHDSKMPLCQPAKK
ncbi:MAG: acyl-ACP--UDP-N-acetylglucosamine O-acyltransferase [Bdellovibrionales bacterium]